MKKKNTPEKNRYSESFKRKVCQEYLTTGASKMSLLKKYNIRFKSGIQKWLKVYGYEDIHIKTGYLPAVTVSPLTAKKINGTITDTNHAQEKRIKELERLLEDEQLRSEAYSRIIDIAEKEFNLPIRKKPNTK